MPSLRMFFAALTSASKVLPQLVQTKRDRLTRLLEKCVQPYGDVLFRARTSPSLVSEMKSLPATARATRLGLSSD